MTTSPASETPRPVTVPTLQDRARVLEPLGWSGRAAEWIALVALHTGVFTRSQWCHFFDHANREAARVFVRALIDKQLAIEDERAIFPGGARAVLLTGKALYRALGIPDMLYAGSTRQFANALNDACEAIDQHVTGGAELITIGEAGGR